MCLLMSFNGVHSSLPLVLIKHQPSGLKHEAESCSSSSDHQSLSPAVSPSPETPMFKCPTLQQKETCLQPGTETVLVSRDHL